jgi:hypothetical protein
MNALVTGVCKPQRLLVGPTTFASARFNAGHSVLLWLLYDHSKLKVTAFDLANHPYPPHAVEWLPKRFGPRLEVVMGTSVETVPAYAAMHPDVACDVLFIDGGHFGEVSANLPTPSLPPPIHPHACFQVPPHTRGPNRRLIRCFRLLSTP